MFVSWSHVVCIIVGGKFHAWQGVRHVISSFCEHLIVIRLSDSGLIYEDFYLLSKSSDALPITVPTARDDRVYEGGALADILLYGHVNRAHKVQRPDGNG